MAAGLLSRSLDACSQLLRGHSQPIHLGASLWPKANRRSEGHWSSERGRDRSPLRGYCPRGRACSVPDLRDHLPRRLWRRGFRCAACLTQRPAARAPCSDYPGGESMAKNGVGRPSPGPVDPPPPRAEGHRSPLMRDPLCESATPRIGRLPGRARWQQTPDVCAFPGSGSRRSASTSRFPSWISINLAIMAAASRRECSYREAAAIRVWEWVRLAANSRCEYSHQSFVAACREVGESKEPPTWGNGRLTSPGW
jgi:hypothetical protein